MGLGALQQRDVANVVDQIAMAMRMRQHEELHGEFGVHHPAGAVLDVEHARGYRVRGMDPLAHGHYLAGQRASVALGAEHPGAYGIEAGCQIDASGAETRASQRLVLPGPRGVAATTALIALERCD